MGGRWVERLGFHGPGMRRCAAAVACVLAAGCGYNGGTGGMTGSGAGPDDVGAPETVIGLVTKTDDNPYFIRIRDAAIAEAGRWRGAKVTALAGRYDGDTAGQVAAVEQLLAAHVKGILITPSSSTGIVDVLRTARSRGVLVIVLDTETTPADVADATFATENITAGEQQGAYLRAALGGAPAKVVMLDGSPGSTVDSQRHAGFLRGFAPGPGELLATAATNGDPATAQRAMSQLLDQHPDLDAAYTVDEPAAEGAHQALLARGVAGRVKLATIDGSCPGVLSVRSGRYVADVMQFPTAMATEGVDAVMTFVTTQQRPAVGTHDTGSQVVANQSSPGLTTRDPTWGLRNCWG
jgi:fructose transport system substrate-binding protein